MSETPEADFFDQWRDQIGPSLIMDAVVTHDALLAERDALKVELHNGLVTHGGLLQRLHALADAWDAPNIPDMPLGADGWASEYARRLRAVLVEETK